MSTQHTPGPWSQGRTLMTAQTRQWMAKQIAENDTRERTMIFANFHANDEGRGRFLVADCCSIEADARLIAAAPDLLESLKDILPLAAQMNAATGAWNKQLGKARLAIAKAEGH